MALVNHAKREINAKIVYYGAEKVGKATSLRYVYDRIKPSLRGELKAIPASGSSLLFFDFSPFEQPVFGGYRVRLHIYTLQGKVANPAAWKMTLKGADGIVIVADASSAQVSSSRESLLELRDYLGSYGVGLHDIPFVLQLNKQDLSGQSSVEDAKRAIGLAESNSFLTSAVNGAGVLETLTALSKLIMELIGKREDLQQVVPTLAGDNIGHAIPEGEHQAGLVVSHDTKMKAVSDIDTVISDDSTADLENQVYVPAVSIGGSGVSVDGTTVRIPLNISKQGGMQRIVVTVDVSLEQ